MKKPSPRTLRGATGRHAWAVAQGRAAIFYAPMANFSGAGLPAGQKLGIVPITSDSGWGVRL